MRIRRSTVLLFVAIVAPLPALAGTLPAAGADQPYRVTIDGRRVDARTPSGRSRNGVFYINLVRAVKSFDGLLTFAPGGVARVTIGVKTVDFRIGSSVARSGNATLHLPGAPFVYDGDEYVPLATMATLASAKVRIDQVRHQEVLTSAASSQSDVPDQREDSALAIAAPMANYTLRARILTPIPREEPPISLGVTAPSLVLVA